MSPSALPFPLLCVPSLFLSVSSLFSNVPSPSLCLSVSSLGVFPEYPPHLTTHPPSVLYPSPVLVPCFTAPVATWDSIMCLFMCALGCWSYAPEYKLCEGSSVSSLFTVVSPAPCKQYIYAHIYLCTHICAKSIYIVCNPLSRYIEIHIQRH